MTHNSARPIARLLALLTVFVPTSLNANQIAKPKSIPPPPTSSTSFMWIYGGDVGQASRSVAVGNDGTFSWVTRAGSASSLALISTIAYGHAPTPIDVFPLGATRRVQVAAPRSAPLALVVTESPFGASTLRLRSAFSDFTATASLPPGTSDPRLSISDDGVIASVGYSGPTGVEVRLYATSAGFTLAPLHTFQLGAGAYLSHELSGDASKLLVATDVGTRVLDVASEAVELDSPASAPGCVCAIDADGDTVARASNDATVWKASVGGYTPILRIEAPPLGFTAYTALALSRDGSTLVLAQTEPLAPTIALLCFALTESDAVLLWQYERAATPGEVFNELSVSDDGRHVAASTAGGSPNSEVLLFDRDSGASPITGVAPPGQVTSLEIGSRGRFVTFGYLTDPSDSTGGAACLRRGGQSLSARGTPRVAGMVDLTVHGAIGDLALLLLSTKLLGEPTDALGYTGQLFVDPDLLFFPATPFGMLTTTSLTDTVAMPTEAGLVGLTLFAQTVRLGSNELDNYVQLPLVE